MRAPEHIISWCTSEEVSIMKTKSFSLTLLLCASTTHGFAPGARQNHQRSARTLPSQLNLGAFDEYLQTAEDQELAYADTLVGTGEMAMEGKFVTMAYRGNLMADQTTFDSGSISFRLGENKVIKGWEQGMVLKTSPGLSYGDRGAEDGVILSSAYL